MEETKQDDEGENYVKKKSSEKTKSSGDERLHDLFMLSQHQAERTAQFDGSILPTLVYLLRMLPTCPSTCSRVCRCFHSGLRKQGLAACCDLVEVTSHAVRPLRMRLLRCGI